MYIHADIYEKLSKALVTYAKTIKLGDGADETTQMGPIQNRPQFERLQKMLKEAQEQNLKFLMVGQVPEGKGFFFPIVLVDNPPDTARVVTEEAFGPILPLMKFKDIDEVIERANNNPYGLGGTVWSADTVQAKRIAERLQTGTVWINQPIAPSPKAPFAGRKQSGLGIENGAEGLLEYTATQTIMLNTAQP
jgi:acyl-CoA reductase-like NAD-dependent aldehyde dehydrogenase